MTKKGRLIEHRSPKQLQLKNTDSCSCADSQLSAAEQQLQSASFMTLSGYDVASSLGASGSHVFSVKKKGHVLLPSIKMTSLTTKPGSMTSSLPNIESSKYNLQKASTARSNDKADTGFYNASTVNSEISSFRNNLLQFGQNHAEFAEAKITQNGGKIQLSNCRLVIPENSLKCESSLTLMSIENVHTTQESFSNVGISQFLHICPLFRIQPVETILQRHVHLDVHLPDNLRSLATNFCVFYKNSAIKTGKIGKSGQENWEELTEKALPRFVRNGRVLRLNISSFGDIQVIGIVPSLGGALEVLPQLRLERNSSYSNIVGIVKSTLNDRSAVVQIEVCIDSKRRNIILKFTEAKDEQYAGYSRNKVRFMEQPISEARLANILDRCSVDCALCDGELLSVSFKDEATERMTFNLTLSDLYSHKGQRVVIKPRSISESDKLFPETLQIFRHVPSNSQRHNLCSLTLKPTAIEIGLTGKHKENTTYLFKSVLPKLASKIIKSVDIRPILEKLQDGGKLEADEAENIRKLKTPAARTEALLDTLSGKGLLGLMSFVELLEKEHEFVALEMRAVLMDIYHFD